MHFHGKKQENDLFCHSREDGNPGNSRSFGLPLPACAGTGSPESRQFIMIRKDWIPASAGMTENLISGIFARPSTFCFLPVSEILRHDFLHSACLGTFGRHLFEHLHKGPCRMGKVLILEIGNAHIEKELFPG